MPKVLPEYKDLIKSKIIDAALKVFEVKGFYASTMVDIARKIGMSKATVYFYFKSKEELLKMIMITTNQSLGESWKSSFETNDLSISIGKVFDKITTQDIARLPVNLEILAVASRDNLIKQIAQADHEKGIADIEAVLVKLKEKQLIDDNLHTLSQILLGVSWDLIIQRLIGNDLTRFREDWVKTIRKLLEKR